MQGIYNYISETNHVSRVYGVAAVLYLQFVLQEFFFSPLKYVLYFDNSTFRRMCAVSHMAFFCIPLISCSPGMLLRYCRSDSEMVPVAPIILGIAFVFTFHLH